MSELCVYHLQFLSLGSKKKGKTLCKFILKKLESTFSVCKMSENDHLSDDEGDFVALTNGLDAFLKAAYDDTKKAKVVFGNVEKVEPVLLIDTNRIDLCQVAICFDSLEKLHLFWDSLRAHRLDIRDDMLDEWFKGSSLGHRRTHYNYFLLESKSLAEDKRSCLNDLQQLI